MQEIGFIFPGQGSQKPGMLATLAEEFTEIEQTFQEASDRLSIDLWEVAQSDPDNLLDQTHITQPVLLAASVAIWRLWQKCKAPAPAVLAGHSLGEYSALVCAGALSFADAVQLVSQRGRYMQDAVPAGTGAMAAIVGLDEQTIIDLCRDAQQGEIVAAANFNSPGQTVIAGQQQAVERAMQACKAAGAKRALPLKVSVPSHCALMQPAAERLAADLEQINFRQPAIPVIQNVDAQVTDDPEAIKQNLVSQLHMPVLWVDTIKAMHAMGVDGLIECGPGKVLCGLVKRIQSDMTCFGTDDTKSFRQACEAKLI